MRTTRKTRRPEPLQHEIDFHIVDNNLDALAEMLSLYEDDDNLRYILHEAIDLVSANLKVCIIANIFKV